MLTGRLRQLDDDLPPGQDDPALPTPGTPRLRALEIVVGALTGWIAALLFAPVFASTRAFAAPTTAAAAGAAIVAALATRRGLALRWALAASGIVAALFTAYTVLVGSLAGGVVPGRATLSGLRRGLGEGFAEMLAGSLPLRDDTFALVFVTLATWTCVAITTELVQRTRLASLPLLAPVALAALAMPVVAPSHAPSSWHLSALIAVGLLLVLIRAVPDPRATGTVIGPRVDGLAEFHSRSLLSARLTLGVPLIALVALVAPLLGDAISGRRPADPRDLRSEVVEVVRVADPLGEYKRIANQSPRPAFQVRIEGATAIEVARAAIVRLDTYDGVRFGTDDRYEDTGSSLLAASERPIAGRDITARFSSLDLEYPWLPTAGAPLRTDLRGVGYSPSSGDLLAPGSVKGLSYEVRGRLVTPTPAELVAAGVDTSADADRYRALPGGLPPSLGRVASEATQGAVGPAETLDKLGTYLRTNFELDTSAPAGHAAGRLEQFLRTDRRGSPEQFAAAFAVMARTLGYPTRVVVGYKLTTDDDDGTVRPLEFVTSASYHAWVEVKFNGLGWLAYDPSPSTSDTTPDTARGAAGDADTVTPSGGGEQRTPREIGPSEADLADDDASGWLRGLLTALAVVAGIAALIALVVGAVLGGKALRRRRRAARPRPADRIVGAWDEVVDRLIELRLPISASMTPRDITATARAIYGTAATLPLSFLVPDVGRAVFGAVEPGDDVAVRAWERAREFEQNLAITLTSRQRWQARLSLRPLRAPRTESVDTVSSAEPAALVP